MEKLTHKLNQEYWIYVHCDDNVDIANCNLIEIFSEH